MVVVGNYVLKNVTVPRWERYSAVHGYDFLTVTERNTSVTGIATAAWDRIFIALALFRKGYDVVIHADGDSAVLQPKTPIVQYVQSSTGPFGRASPTSFLFVSQDRGRFGSYQPSKRDFGNHISLAPDHMLSGPNNFGVWVMRRSQTAFAALEHITKFSQRTGRAFQSFPAEQGVLNAWLGQNCSRNQEPLPTTGCAYAQAAYGTFQRFIGRSDHPIPNMNRTDWDGALRTVLRLYQDSGVFVLHTPSMGKRPEFLLQTFSLVEKLIPIV